MSLDAHLPSPTRFLEGRLGRLQAPETLARYEGYFEERGRAVSEAVDRAGTPPLRMFDRFGKRIDEVVFPPEYRELVTKGYEAGVVFKAVEEGNLAASYQVGYVTSFYDAGLYCPHTVSLSTAIPLAKYGSPWLRATYLPKLLRRDTSVWQGDGRIAVVDRGVVQVAVFATAYLSIFALGAGVLIACGFGLQESLFEYGRLMGLGFQIWDDVLDLRSDQKTFGKPVLNDIRNGKKTLIAVHALENLKGKEREEFVAVLGKKTASEKELLRAKQILEDSGSIDHAARVSMELVAKAKDRLGVLKDSTHKDALKAFADYMIARKT